MDALVLDGIDTEGGLYPHKRIRLACVTSFLVAGATRKPCINCTGFVGDIPPPPPPPPKSELGPPPAQSAPAVAFLTRTLNKHWMKNGKEVKAPKDYNLGIAVRDCMTRNLVQDVFLNNLNTKDVTGLKDGQCVVVVEDTATIPKGWSSRGELMYTVSAASVGPLDMFNEQTTGPGFFGRICRPKTWAVVCALAAVGIVEGICQATGRDWKCQAEHRPTPVVNKRKP
jgi:hypothetical protein